MSINTITLIVGAVVFGGIVISIALSQRRHPESWGVKE